MDGGGCKGVGKSRRLSQAKAPVCMACKADVANMRILRPAAAGANGFTTSVQWDVESVVHERVLQKSRAIALYGAGGAMLMVT